MNQNASCQHPALIAYPKQAAFGCMLPKNKIYEHSGANARLKELFVEQVEQITWQYKLAPETINLPSRSAVPEIQVFTIQLKTSELYQDVLRCIDGVVPFPIIFELHQGEGEQAQTQVVAAYKRPAISSRGTSGKADTSRWVLSDYFATNWLPATAARSSLPLGIDMAVLYEALLQRLIPLRARPQETLTDLIARVELVATKRRAIEKVQARMLREKQFNRRVEVNASLRQLNVELEQLLGRDGT
ncbi:DUF4391 domain-containing protein [Aeromonas caviae]|uniref:DUF4391 domain-containing protein n=1 Tax=Aeromonas caviae TaxID=648 RepID=UPI0025B68AE0|nr:DUF4391 domain-containing protein [Aeromonas caviae]